MAIHIRRVAVRFALLLAAAAVIPLIAFGIISVLSLQRGTHESIVAGNANVATRAAEEIRRYLVENAAILTALAADLQDTGLQPWQQDRIVKNYVLRFREFREISLFDEAGATLATSRIGRPRVAVPAHTAVTLDGVALSPLRVDDEGRTMLAVAAAIPQLGWDVVVEQPTSEAYASARQLQQQLLISISTALLAMVSVGYLFGRSFINPIVTLQRATHAVAAGELGTRVEIRRDDELGELGASFNTMANRLAELQEDIKKKERHAMFGRMAAGLVHDLSHPIQNIGNSSRLLLRDDLDPESRDLFRKTIERELDTLKRFMD